MGRPVILGGLPRSGSTLLSALLRQNPDFNVTPTGFLLGLLEGMQNQWTASEPRKAWKDQEGAKARLHRAMGGAIDGYLDDGHHVSVEKSRGAFAHLEALELALAEPPKIIAPVRDLRAVAASMEKLWRRSPEYQGFGAPTVGDRVAKWMNPEQPPLGAILPQIKDAFHRGVADRALFVRFEDLTTDPEAELRRIYAYLDLPYPEGVHQFHAVGDTNREHDAIHGPFGDHELSPGPVQALPEDWAEYLGPHIPRELIANNRWFYQDFYPERLEDAA